VGSAGLIHGTANSKRFFSSAEARGISKLEHWIGKEVFTERRRGGRKGERANPKQGGTLKEKSRHLSEVPREKNKTEETAVGTVDLGGPRPGQRGGEP